MLKRAGFDSGPMVPRLSDWGLPLLAFTYLSSDFASDPGVEKRGMGVESCRYCWLLIIARTCPTIGGIG